MEVYCLEEFRTQFRKLDKTRNHYRDIHQLIIDNLFNKSFEELTQANNPIRLNIGEENPYVKIRLQGSKGYRVYYYLIIKKNNIYLIYLYPKKRPLGADDLTPKAYADFLEKTVEAIDLNNLYQLSVKDNKKIIFTKISAPVKVPVIVSKR